MSESTDRARQGDALPARLVLYDGLCGLCDRTVQWLLDHDPDGRFRFAALQSGLAAEVRSRHAEIPEQLDSIIYVETLDGVETVYWRSRAAFRICRELPGAWRALSWLRVFPSFLTDLGYRFVARIRYRVWGKLDTCRVPTPTERARFLDVA